MVTKDAWVASWAPSCATVTSQAWYRQKSRVSSGLDFGERLRLDQHLELEAVGGAILEKDGQALVLEKHHLHIEVFGGHSEHPGQAPALADRVQPVAVHAVHQGQVELGSHL